MKAIIHLILFCFFAVSCEKSSEIIDITKPLPKTCLEGSKVIKTLVNWPISTANTNDTIYWQYDIANHITAAVQGGKWILKVDYFPSGFKPDSVTIATETDSVRVIYMNDKPLSVHFFDKQNKTATDKSSVFNYSPEGYLINVFESGSSMLANNSTGFSYTQKDLYRLRFLNTTTGSMPAKYTYVFERFSYSNDISNIPFLPFISTTPRPISQFGNDIESIPMYGSMLDAFIWGRLLRPYLPQYLIESYTIDIYSISGKSDKSLVKASMDCSTNFISYRVNHKETQNFFE